MGNNSNQNLEFDFSFSGERSNQKITLLCQGSGLESIQITTNAEIKKPWGNLVSCLRNIARQTKGNVYVYTLEFADKTLSPGSYDLIYSVENALGPITNVAMPPSSIKVKPVNGDWQDLPLKGKNSIPNNPHPKTTFKMYHANWGQYQFDRNMNDEAWSDINELAYAFVGFDKEGKIFSLDVWADMKELPLLYMEKQKRPYLNTAISFGGWTNAGVRMDTVFSELAKNSTARQTFAKNAVAAAKQVGANGIDIDWEYPKAADAENFRDLMIELRDALDASGIENPRLSIAAPASAEDINGIGKENWQIIAGVCDEISVMNYDYFGSFSILSDFLAPWELSEQSPHFETNFSVAKTMEIYTEKMGISPDKLSMGIPNYARSMVVDQPGLYGGLYQPVVGKVKGDNNNDEGIFSWNTIYNFLQNTPSELDKLGVKKWNFYDSNHPLCSQAKMCLLSGELPNGKTVVLTFLDEPSAKWRAYEAKKLGFQGTMVWANYNETKDSKTMLSSAISQGLESKYNYGVSKSIDPIKEACSYKKGKSKFSEDSIKYKKMQTIGTMLACKNYEEMKKYFNNNQDTLSTHRYFPGSLLQVFMPNDLVNSLIGEPDSLKVARALLRYHSPTKVFERDTMPVPDYMCADNTSDDSSSDASPEALSQYYPPPYNPDFFAPNGNRNNNPDDHFKEFNLTRK